MSAALRLKAPRDRGFALIIVLWALVPIALIFVTLAATARSDARSAADLRIAATLEAAADGAIYTGIFDILRRGDANIPAYSIRMPGGNVTVDFTGLSGLVNPNAASSELLQALMRRLGTDPGSAGFIASAILDWRTPGQKARPGGAKAAEYRSAGLGYGPPGAPFESLDELGQVLGMTPRLLLALTPHLSLYAYGMPDPGAADPIVRAALRDTGVTTAALPRTQVVQITAVATGAGQARSVRRGIVRIELEHHPTNRDHPSDKDARVTETTRAQADPLRSDWALAGVARRWRVLRWGGVPGR